MAKHWKMQLILLHLVLSPLVFSTTMTESFEIPKISLLIMMGLLLSAAWVSELASFERDPLTIGVLLFVASSVISTFVSMSPRISVLGAEESHAGLIAVIAYAVLFFGTRSVFKSTEDLRRLFAVLAVPASLTSLYALAQWLGHDPIAWVGGLERNGQIRGFGTLGHPNILATYLGMLIPAFGVLALKTPNRKTRWLFAGVSLLSLAALVVTFSRSTWLALVSGLALLFFLSKQNRLFLKLGTVAMAGALAMLAWKPQTIVDLGIRGHYWAGAWRVFKENPFFGSGLDTFQLAYQHQRTVDYWRAQWAGGPIKAHNEFLQILSTQGLFGALCVLVLTFGIVVIARKLWRGLSAEDRPLAAGVLAGIIVFYVQNLFNFTTAASGVLFVTFAGALAGLADPKTETRKAADWLPLRKGLSLGAWVTALALIVWGLANPIAANLAAKKGTELLKLNPLEALKSYETAIALDPHHEAYVILLGRGANLIAHSPRDEREKRLYQKISIRAFALAAEMVPERGDNHASLAATLADPLNDSRGAPATIRRSLASFDRAISLEPNNPIYLLEASKAAASLGLTDRARNYAIRSKMLYPERFGGI